MIWLVPPSNQVKHYCCLPTSLGKVQSSFLPPIRNDLALERPYGAPQLNIPISLNVNENTHPLPRDLVEALGQNLSATFHHLNRYPDREFLKLRAVMADFLGHGLTAEQIWAANGSNEVLQQIFLAFGGSSRTALNFAPSYSMYANLALISATRFVSIPRAPDFSISQRDVETAINANNPSITLICNPNNPTGTLTPLSVIEAAAECSTGLVVVDEAYAEFSGAPSALSLLGKYPNLIVSRTMSKAFSFAGVRVGYLAANEAVVDALRIVRLPYHLSALTQAAALTAFQFAEEMLATVSDIRDERERLRGELVRLGLDPFESSANFLLVGGFSDPANTFDELLARGVLIRNVGIDGTLRITVGTRSENDALLAALAVVLYSRQN